MSGTYEKHTINNYDNANNYEYMYGLAVFINCSVVAVGFVNQD